jgi:hypothetical protein
MRTYNGETGLIIFISAQGQLVRPMTRYEASSIIKEAEADLREHPSIFKLIALRKLKVQRVSTYVRTYIATNEPEY